MRKVWIPVVGFGVTAALQPLYPWAQAQPDTYDCRWGPHMMGWGGGWYGMFFGPLMMVLVLALVVGAVALALRWGGATWHAGGPPPRKPLDILKERFARGEIDKDEFEERRKLLGD
jgi:putative membrane protein